MIIQKRRGNEKVIVLVDAEPCPKCNAFMDLEFYAKGGRVDRCKECRHFHVDVTDNRYFEFLSWLI